MEAPTIEFHHYETPSPLNILGVKGVGEGGTIIAPPALVNALCNATGAKFNTTPVRHRDIYAALHNRQPTTHHMLTSGKNTPM
jgi:carbon-monoxide dehydrogenase large subunit